MAVDQVLVLFSEFSLGRIPSALPTNPVRLTTSSRMHEAARETLDLVDEQAKD
jgi:hypothetical protein